MIAEPILVAEELERMEAWQQALTVSLSHELVGLLSSQLYQSPLKAIEELVVNAYDADATECRVFVPTSDNHEIDFCLVYDDGVGMSYEGLVNLWQIGRSNKRQAEIERLRRRKQIGKFGIGKLATYTIAHRLTYITKDKGQILSVSVDFRTFASSATGAGTKVEVPVRIINDWTAFLYQSPLSKALERACVHSDVLADKATWTIAILEELKDKAREIKQGELQWVLSTAMPLKVDFRLFLNCQEVKSSKEGYEVVSSFELKDLPSHRLANLSKNTGETWSINDDRLKSPSFPSGITGNVWVTRRVLGGKSDDIARSHGFFVRVRDRLVDEGDPLFGLKPLTFETFSRFRAEINADDLDSELKASREALEESSLKTVFRSLLREIFNEATTQYEAYLKTQENDGKKEGTRNTVPPQYVEYPIADALWANKARNDGAEADESWFYMELAPEVDLRELVQVLYTVPRHKYEFKYDGRGTTSRMVKFDPSTATFYINTDHDLVKEYVQEPHSRYLLEDFVTAEALLEVYLREGQVPPHVVGSVLERRDVLLRSLARDRSYSPEMVSQSLRDAAANEYELEIALVVAARTLGFVAAHIAGSGEPDGIARLAEFSDGQPTTTKTITLEAKSSLKVPQLNQLDFGGLREHVTRRNADGCLLLAPAYPGATRDDPSAVDARAIEQRISCWTIDQLARVVSSAETRHISAHDVLTIVLSKYAPHDVAQAVESLLTTPQWNQVALYRAVLRALRSLEDRMRDTPRNVDQIATEVTREDELRNIERKKVAEAVRELAGASQGGMMVRGENVVIYVSLEELGRRLSGMTKQTASPRRISSFRKSTDQ